MLEPQTIEQGRSALLNLAEVEVMSADARDMPFVTPDELDSLAQQAVGSLRQPRVWWDRIWRGLTGLASRSSDDSDQTLN